jgi:hypothetical protein
MSRTHPLVALLALSVPLAAHAQTRTAPKPKKPSPPPKAAAPAPKPTPTPAPAKPVVPETPATPEELAEGQSRIDALLLAHGGEAFLNLKTFVLKGKGAVNQGGALIPFDAVTLSVASPDRMRMDVTTPFGEIAQVFPGAGKSGWLEFGGSVQDLPATVTLPDPTQILRELITKGKTPRALPETAEKPVGGKTLQGVSLKGEKGTARVFLEPDTHLARLIVLTGGPQGTVRLQLGNYQPAVDGVVLPGAFQVVVGGVEMLSLTFDSRQINPPLADTLFVRPKP